MSKININYSVECAPSHSKHTVLKLLQALEDKYAITHEFTSDHECTLSGAGVSGKLSILDQEIEIFAKLGFMMMPFKSIIETEIINKLNESFAT